MPGDGDLRVRPWVPATGDTEDDEPVTDLPQGEEGEESESEPRNWWDDLPDPWDRPYQNSDVNTDELPIVDGKRGSRSRRDMSLRRIAVLVVVVGAVLIGTGTLVRMLAPEQSALPVPPPTPPEQVFNSSPPSELGRLGQAPTPGLTPSASPFPSTPPPATTGPGSAPTRDGGTTTAPASVRASHEAEDAELGGLAYRYQTSEASGGEAVGWIGMWGSNYVEFQDVTVPRAGEYELTFHYLTARDRTGEFSANDGRLVALDFPGLGSSGAVGTVTVTVELAAGSNRIWFGYTGSRGPDLDRITITG